MTVLRRLGTGPTALAFVAAASALASGHTRLDSEPLRNPTLGAK